MWVIDHLSNVRGRDPGSGRLIQAFLRDDVVSRLAGAESTVFCSGINTAPEAQRVGEALCQKLLQLYRIGNREILMSASVGVALATKHDSTLDELLAKADAAMYRATKTKKDKYFISACRL